MAGTTLYLIRSSNLTYAKQESVVDVFLSSKGTAYASVTGAEATDVVTIAGATLANGMLVTLTSLTGGSGASTGVGYYAIDASGATCKLSLTPGGSAINFTTDITAGSAIVQAAPMQVWSTEFRDIFGNTTNLFAGTGTTTAGGVPYAVQTAFEAAAAVIPSEFDGGAVTATTIGSYAGGLSVRGTTDLSTSISDEINHQPLRQTLLNRSFWIFDRGANATPRYLPAEYQEGDIIATSPPNTP
jgi:hypothetical protein